MGILADRLDTMQVRVVSPDGNISGLLRGRSDVMITFREGAYQRYTEQALAEQLVALARLLWAGRTREYYAALSEAFGHPITGESAAIGERELAYRAARDELVAEGVSSDGLVYLGAQGMRAFAVRIAEGALATLTEDEFAARAYEASHAMIADQFAKIRRLKDYCFAGE
ncbi:MAG TPA: hypothetical protein VH442_21590 [Micromonosporaceae bacterium]